MAAMLRLGNNVYKMVLSCFSSYPFIVLNAHNTSKFC
jgi:hypothetical protein